MNDDRFLHGDPETDTNDTDWPKPWEEIVPTSQSHMDDDDTLYIQHGTRGFELSDGLRVYRGTLYACVDMGQETDSNRDLWLPFDLYVARRVGSDG